MEGQICARLTANAASELAAQKPSQKRALGYWISVFSIEASLPRLGVASCWQACGNAHDLPQHQVSAVT